MAVEGHCLAVVLGQASHVVSFDQLACEGLKITVEQMSAHSVVGRCTYDELKLLVVMEHHLD